MQGGIHVAKVRNWCENEAVQVGLTNGVSIRLKIIRHFLIPQVESGNIECSVHLFGSPWGSQKLQLAYPTTWTNPCKGAFMWRKSEIGVRMKPYKWVWQMASQSGGMQNSLLAAGADHRHLQDKQNAPLHYAAVKVIRIVDRFDTRQYQLKRKCI